MLFKYIILLLLLKQLNATNTWSKASENYTSNKTSLQLASQSSTLIYSTDNNDDNDERVSSAQSYKEGRLCITIVNR